VKKLNFVKNRNFGQKPKFWEKIEIFWKQSKFWEKIEILVTK